MIHTIKNIVTQPLFLFFDYSIKKFSIFTSLFLIALFLLGTNIYIYNMSFSLLNQKAVVEEEVSENTVNTVTIEKGDTLNAILKRENINNPELKPHENKTYKYNNKNNNKRCTSRAAKRKNSNAHQLHSQ